MASISQDRTGKFLVQFAWQDKRHTLRIGDVSRKTAEAFKARLESLVATAKLGLQLDAELMAWSAALDAKLSAQLKGLGLLQRREGEVLPQDVPTLQAFVLRYVEMRKDWALNTRNAMLGTGKRLVGFFGPLQVIADITPGLADEFAIHLRSTVAAATAARSIKHCRQLFKHGVRKGWLVRNPFEDVAAGSMANEARQQFVEQETVLRAIEAAPDAEWRAIIALSRFAGLRVPSEILELKLADLDFAKSRFRVVAPKLKGKETGHIRVVPMFPALRPYLEDVFDAASPGQVYLIHRHRLIGPQYRYRFLQILEKAGITPWPRLWHQLRASLQTELVATHPAHTVGYWLGNSEEISRKHYLSVRESDYSAAICAAVHYGNEQPADCKSNQNSAGNAHYLSSEE